VLGFGAWHQVEIAAFVFPFKHAMLHFFVSFTPATLFGVAFNSVCFVAVFILFSFFLTFHAKIVLCFGLFFFDYILPKNVGKIPSPL